MDNCRIIEQIKHSSHCCLHLRCFYFFNILRYFQFYLIFEKEQRQVTTYTLIRVFIISLSIDFYQSINYLDDWFSE